MLRIQAKDITEKDREIKRLTSLLEFHKKEKIKEKSKKLDTLMDNVTSKAFVDPEPVSPETGEVNPNFIYDKEEEDKEKESEPSLDGEIHITDKRRNLASKSISV